MPGSRNLSAILPTYQIGLLLLVFIAVVCVAFTVGDSDGFNLVKREVLLRKVGHELLLQSGDSSSRVLPIQKISENQYRIRFENDLTFQADSLIAITRRLLAKDPVGSDYVVTVLNCGNASVAFGYAISKTGKDDILACMGRKQPMGCYRIDIKFKPTGVITARNGYLLGSLLFVAFFGFAFFRSVKHPSPIDSDSHLGQSMDRSDVIDRSDTDGFNTDLFTIGSMLFDAKNRKLVIHAKTVANVETIDLTRTETRVLRIFALSPNEAIERSRLQKEIWEDEGVIVGRSLDMFICKLRKKLEFDPNIKIVVIRGKGYKLEIIS